MDIEQLAGTKLGNYEIESLLGQGGMGVVYKARQLNLDRPVALKILRPVLSSDASFVKRFKREARAVARLNHANIIQIHDIAEAGGLHFFSMEYVEGQTLSHVIEEKIVLSVEEAVGVITQVARALEHAHQKKITHRDIKPPNIILDSNGSVKVMDFGLAQIAEAHSKLTQSGLLMGTVAYMSPEQCQGEMLDHRTDIYSLGIVLYEMLTGATPFSADTTAALIYKIVYEAPVEVRVLNPNVPPELSMVLSHAIAKKKENRFTNVSEFLQHVSSFKAREVEKLISDAPSKGIRPVRMTTLEREAMFQVEKGIPFVGRSSEMTALGRLLGRASLGQGSLVMIGGEPGVGKTRLTEEFVSEARRQGFLCLRGHCYEMEGGQPYMPFVEIIESAVRRVDAEVLHKTLGAAAPEVAKLVPDLRRKFPDIPPAAELPPEQEQRYVFNGMLDFIERAAQAQPLLLVLEDLHWAGESTMLLVQHVARRLDDMRVLLIGTYRDTEVAVSRALAKILKDLPRERLVHDMVLKRFSKTEVADMLRTRAGQEPPSRLVDVIYEETEGNPFFVEEIYKHLTEEEKLCDSAGQWRSDLRVEEIDVPRGVRLVLGDRLHRVGKQCLETLMTAATIGRLIGSKLLETVVDLDEVAFLDSVEEAERAQLIWSKTQAGDVKIIFSHELIRQTLLSDISGLRRQRLHFRIAEAMEKIYAENLNEYAAELAYHFKKAGALADVQKTVYYLRLAGERAYSMGALAEAIEFYVGALSFKMRKEDEAEIHYKLGLAYSCLGRSDEALDKWRRTLTLYEQLDMHEAVGNVCSDISPRLLWASRFQEALEISNRGLAALGDRINAARCVLLAASGHVLAYVPAVGYELPHSMFTQALEMAEELGEKQLEGPILFRKAMFHRNYWQGPEEADCALKSAEVLRAGNSPFYTANALLAAEWGLIGVGHLEEAANVEQELDSFAAGTVEELNRCVLDLYSCLREVIVTGNLERLETRISASLQESLALQWGWIYMDYVLLGWSQFWRGKWELAEKQYRKAMEMIDPRAEGFVGYLISPLLVLLSSSGRREEALTLIDERKNLLPSVGQANLLGAWTMLEGTIQSLFTLGRYDEAAKLYPLAREAVATGNVVSPSCAGLVQTLAGIAAAAGKEWEHSEKHFEIAINQAHEIPHIIEQPEVRRWYALMLMERMAPGDKDMAHKLLVEAIDKYREIGMPRHLERAEELLKKIGMDK